MSISESPRLNLNLFRLDVVKGAGIALSRGILARQGAERTMFIDLATPLSRLAQPEQIDMSLKLDADLTRTLPRSGSLVYEASVPIISSGFGIKDPFDSNELGREADDPRLKSAALVAMTETAELTLLRPQCKDTEITREVLSAELPVKSTAAQHVAKLILVFDGSPMKVAAGNGTTMGIYEIHYNESTANVISVDSHDDRDSDDQASGPSSGDPQPISPTGPYGSRGTLLTLPVRKPTILRAVSDDRFQQRRLAV